jgi:hypothetical protein
VVVAHRQALLTALVLVQPRGALGRGGVRVVVVVVVAAVVVEVEVVVSVVAGRAGGGRGSKRAARKGIRAGFDEVWGGSRAGAVMLNASMSPPAASPAALCTYAMQSAAGPAKAPLARPRHPPSLPSPGRRQPGPPARSARSRVASAPSRPAITPEPTIAGQRGSAAEPNHPTRQLTQLAPSTPTEVSIMSIWARTPPAAWSIRRFFDVEDKT